MSFLGYLFQAIIVQNLMLNYMIGFDLDSESKSFKSIFNISIILLAFSLVIGLPLWLMNSFLLVPYELDFLRLILLGLVSLVPLALVRKLNIAHKEFYINLLYSLLVMGTVLIMMIQEKEFLGSLAILISGPVAFYIINSLLHGVEQKLSLVKLPEAMIGWPVKLTAAGLLSLIFASIDHLFLYYFV